jgi:hypothetical protein
LFTIRVQHLLLFSTLVKEIFSFEVISLSYFLVYLRAASRRPGLITTEVSFVDLSVHIVLSRQANIFSLASSRLANRTLACLQEPSVFR